MSEALNEVAGACHCGGVKFSARLSDGLNTARRCTCSFCSMRGAVAVSTKLDGLEVTEGAELLSEYRFKGNLIMGLYLALGIMIPIRIGTVAILEMMVATGLVNSLMALILVYTAQGLPLAVFILSEFMRQVSDDLKNAGRIDGLSEYTIFFRLVLPLVRPAMATVAPFGGSTSRARTISV